MECTWEMVRGWGVTKSMSKKDERMEGEHFRMALKVNESEGSNRHGVADGILLG
jgi:hypothetical protein